MSQASTKHMSSPEPIAVRSTVENCARIKKLGYVAGKHMDLYGEHLELVSDPFEEGDCVAVHAVSVLPGTWRQSASRKPASASPGAKRP